MLLVSYFLTGRSLFLALVSSFFLTLELSFLPFFVLLFLRRIAFVAFLGSIVVGELTMVFG